MEYGKALTEFWNNSTEEFWVEKSTQNYEEGKLMR